jgi:hypothetical protein
MGAVEDDAAAAAAAVANAETVACFAAAAAAAWQNLQRQTRAAKAQSRPEHAYQEPSNFEHAAAAAVAV